MNRAVGEGRRRGPIATGVLLAGAVAGAALSITALSASGNEARPSHRSAGTSTVNLAGPACHPPNEAKDELARTRLDSSRLSPPAADCGTERNGASRAAGNAAKVGARREME